MASGPLKTQYVVEILKTGDGATAAVADLNKVQTAATAANTATATYSREGAKNIKGAVDAMRGPLQLLGLTYFPQATTAAMGLNAGFSAVKNGAAALNIPFAAAAGAIAAVTGAIVIATQAIKTFNAEANASDSGTALIGGNQRLSETIAKRIGELQSSFAISAEQADKFRAAMRSARLEATAAAESDALRKLARDLIGIQEGVNAAEKFADTIRHLKNELLLGTLADEPAEGTQRAQLRVGFALEDRLDKIRELRKENAISAEEAIRLSEQAQLAWEKELAAVLTSKKEISEWKRAARGFASGLSGAIVDFASGIKEADDAFREFGSNFLRLIADMILQTIILNTLKNAFGGVLGFSSGGIAGAGGVQFAAAGIAGVGTVTQPTFFPRFNVVGGEAGPEYFTVLSRPRMMEFGGIQAAVGNAGAAGPLAITRASDLERMGEGAAGEIVIRLAPGLQAEMVGEAVASARVRVVEDMRQDSPLSKATKQILS